MYGKRVGGAMENRHVLHISYLIIVSMISVSFFTCVSGNEVISTSFVPIEVYPVRANTMDFSPDSTMLALGLEFGLGHSQIVLINTRSWLAEVKILQRDCEIIEVEWSRDGSYLAVAAQDNRDQNNGNLTIYSTLDWNVTAAMEYYSSVHSISWDPNGYYIAAVNDTGMNLWRTNDWTNSFNFTLTDQYIVEVDWAPSGDLIAIGVVDHSKLSSEVIIFDTQNMNISHQIDDLSFEPLELEWSPKEGYLAIGNESLEYVTSYDWERVQLLEICLPARISWSYLEDFFVIRSGNELIFFKIGKVSPFQTLDLGQNVRSISWSPNGTYLAVGAGSTVVVFETELEEFHDSDGDGVYDDEDTFPWDSSEWMDTDSDGYED
ncbi:MAG: WD40 repeat domain-containing protein, partial [Thermoplasmata archaeon]|nr:WD40 repeat domain-containing protein [Thermoplasmata archaeon]